MFMINKPCEKCGQKYNANASECPRCPKENRENVLNDEEITAEGLQTRYNWF